MVTLDIDNPGELPLPPVSRLEAYARQVCRTQGDESAALSIAVLDEAAMQALNSAYRDKAAPTNVLSFPFERPPGLPSGEQEGFLGDLVLCPAVIEAEARRMKCALSAHWAHIFIHGLLHLYHYDHINEEDAAVMEALEVRLLQQFGIGNPYETGTE